MSNTLPPGWHGSDAWHKTDILGVRVIVIRTKKDEYRWSSFFKDYLTTALIKHSDTPHKTAALARADGLAAVEAFARKLLEETAKLREAPNE